MTSGICQCVLLALLVLSPALCHADWNLVWSDEFAQPDGSSPDPTKWGFDTGNGGWGNNELEYYTSRTNNARIEGGQLVIEACQESYGGSSYTSARLLTKGKWSWTYGRMEARIKIPRGQGLWPAFWTLGTNIDSVGWPACGEIDIMENIGREPNLVHGTMHGPGYSGANGIGGPYGLPGGAAFADDFHIYAIEWTTNQLKWFVDGQLYFETSPVSLPHGTTWVFNQPQFLLLNVAVGGNWPGNPDGTTVFPQRMTVDYVHVYSYVPALTPPGMPTGLNTSPGSNTVYLTWDDSGAPAYNVKRATASGGPYTTVACVPTNSYTDTGVSGCSTYYYVVSATNSLGESVNSAEKTAALGAFALAVNSGGGAIGQFGADANVTGGTQAAAVTAWIDTSGLAAPAPQAVYQTERYGNFTYTFPGLVSGANYKVRLHFAETYWTAVGQRQFNVSIDGSQVLTNFDIVSIAGAPNKATIQEFNAVASGGQIVIQYTTVIDNAKSSGIEIILAQPGAPAGLTPKAGSGQVALNWDPLPGATYNLKRRLAGQGSYITVFSGLTGTQCVDSGLANGVTYYYVVSAVVLGCEGTNSMPVSAVPANLSIQPAAGNVILNWPGGTLQSATNIGGPWLDVSNATSPRTNPAVTTQEFYRLKPQ